MLSDHDGPLFPPLSDIRKVACQISQAVSNAAQEEGVAEVMGSKELGRRLEENIWDPSDLIVAFCV